MIILLIFFYVIFTLLHLNILFYSFCHSLYINTIMFNFLSIIVLPVIFYHIIFTLTQQNPKERFSNIHYIIPVAIYLIYSICSFFVPYDIKYKLAYSPLALPSEYRWFYFFDRFCLLLKALAITVYLFFSIKSIIRYRKNIVNYSSDIETSHLKWLYNIFIWLLTICITVPILYVVSEQNSNTEYVAHILFNVTIFIFDIFFCYNILTDHFTLITEDKLYNSNKVEPASRTLLNKQKFEIYIKEKKPYLEYNLKITELALSLATNRTYLSKFINENYKMNFSTYINKCRLDEMEQIKKQPSYAGLPEAELVYLAGFKSYNSYKKVKEIFK